MSAAISGFLPAVETSYKEQAVERAKALVLACGSRDHCKQDQEHLLEFCKDLRGTALIIGNSVHIPFAKLASQFERVTIVDMDLSYVKSCIEKFEPSLRGKVELIEGDVTGRLAFISQKIEGLKEGRMPFKWLRSAAKILTEATLQPVFIPVLSRYDFVVSSMCSSHLFSDVRAYVMKALSMRCKGIEITKSPQFEGATWALKADIELRHLEHLASWVLPSGKVYYADLFCKEVTHVELVEEAGESDLTLNFNTSHLETQSLLPQEKIEAKIATLFRSVQGKSTWQFEEKPIRPQIVHPGFKNLFQAMAISPGQSATTSLAMGVTEGNLECRVLPGETNQVYSYYLQLLE